jgi:FMN phosphatase YigB (HAD superfamily)
VVVALTWSLNTAALRIAIAFFEKHRDLATDHDRDGTVFLAFRTAYLRHGTPVELSKFAPISPNDGESRSAWARCSRESSAPSLRGVCRMTLQHRIVFLVDVDNTLLDNDRIQQDLKDHLERAFGAACRERYWTILEDLFAELGYRDYIGALQRYRMEHPHEVELLSMSSFLMDYPFADRLFPVALEVLKRLRSLGPTVILSDGDVVFQPRKVDHAGLYEAVDGHVLIYIHKEKALDDVERRYPAEHYVLVDDKLRILAAVKQFWGERVTTVFPRQGIFAHDPEAINAFPPADVTIERIGDLLECDLPRLRAASRLLASNLKVAR